MMFFDIGSSYMETLSVPLKPILVAPGEVVFGEGGSDPIPPGLKCLICLGTPPGFSA